MTSGYSIWDLPHYLAYLVALKSGMTAAAQPPPVLVPSEQELGSDMNKLSRLDLMLIATMQAARMPSGPTDNLTMKDLPTFVAGIVAGVAPVPAPVPPIPKPQPVPSPKPQPNTNMNITVTKKINPKQTGNQPWTFPEGAPRFGHGVSPDGTFAIFEVDPTTPGNPCVCKVTDILEPLIGGVVGWFKQGNKIKFVSTTCLG